MARHPRRTRTVYVQCHIHLQKQLKQKQNNEKNEFKTHQLRLSKKIPFGSVAGPECKLPPGPGESQFGGAKPLVKQIKLKTKFN